jgi:hypothetical protein
MFMKNIIKTFTILSITLFTNQAFSQQKITGQILDSLTQQPIAYALVQNTETTVVSNLEGNFEIFVNSNQNKNLALGSLGYQSKTYQIDKLSTLIGLKIYLTPQSITLNEVIVKPINIIELLISSTKTSSEKFNNSVFLSGYYREVVKRDSFLSKYADGLINYYLEKDKKNKTDVTVSVLQSRVKEIDLKEEDDKVDALNSKIDIDILPKYIRPNILSVLDSNTFKNYVFQLSEIESKRPVYKITFKPLQNATIPLNEGVIYIDKETNLILSLDSKFCPTKNVPYIYSLSLLGITASATDREVIVKYKIEGDNYYPLYCSLSVKISLTSKKYNQTSSVKSEFLSFKYDNQSVLKPTSNIYTKKYLYKNGSKFTNEFWKSINTISNNEEEVAFLKD